MFYFLWRLRETIGIYQSHSETTINPQGNSTHPLLSLLLFLLISAFVLFVV